MPNMLASLPRPVIFAHRGASRHAPENTMAAFELAAKQGAPAIELDVRLSRDGQVVVFHDTTLERTTNGFGRLAQKTADELRDLDAGSHLSQEFRGQRIPFLEEVFESLGRKVLINVQFALYARTPRQLIQAVCELIQKHGLQAHTILSSFHGNDLHDAYRRLGSVSRGLLAARGRLGAWARSFGFAFGDFEALHPHVADATVQHVHRVHKLGRRIHVWTVNDSADITRLTGWGVDGIFTDDPKEALRAIESVA